MLLSTRPGIQALFTAVRYFTSMAKIWDYTPLHLKTPTHADSEKRFTLSAQHKTFGRDS